jgi:hypothetical protein
MKQAIGMPTTNCHYSSIKIDNETITTPLTIANHFNSYFSTVGSNLAQSISSTNEDPVSFLTGHYSNSFFSYSCYSGRTRELRPLSQIWLLWS